MTAGEPPAGYSRVVGASHEVVARDDVLPAVRDLVATHASLYEWARSMPQQRELRGRAPVYVGTLPGTHISLAVRHAWHGGMLAPLTRDRFRAPTRAATELANSLELRRLGIGTTEILAYVLYDAGAGLRRYDVASRYVPDSVDFGAVLSGKANGLAVSRSMRAVVLLLSALARHRVVHPDLNVKNLLLRAHRDAADGDSPQAGDLSAMVIDVDVVRFEGKYAAEAVMAANVSRLVRSMRKWKAQVGAVIENDVIQRLERDCREAVA